MSTVFSRIIRFGLQNFWRYGFASLATVAVLVVALSVFLTLVLFRVSTGAALASIEDKIDISVYFKSATPEEQITNITQSLQTLPEVATLEYVSKDQALQIFRERHRDDEVISQAINELTSNPLLAHINLKANNTEQYETIAQYLTENENINQYIESVSYFDNKAVIERLNSVIGSVNQGVVILTIILAVVASLVVFNTIWLAIYANRDEVIIMRLVGASNALVRGPYVVHGIVAGIVSALISFVIAVPVISAVSPYLTALIPDFSLISYFWRNSILLFLYQVLFGSLLGAVASFLAVRRYLRS